MEIFLEYSKPTDYEVSWNGSKLILGLGYQNRFRVVCNDNDPFLIEKAA